MDVPATDDSTSGADAHREAVTPAPEANANGMAPSAQEAANATPLAADAAAVAPGAAAASTSPSQPLEDRSVDLAEQASAPPALSTPAPALALPATVGEPISAPVDEVPAAGAPGAAERLPREESRAATFTTAKAVMVGLILVSFFLRVLWLDQPTGSQIFDERYYLSAARTILGLPQADDAPYAHSPAGKDPNQEHPALAKLIIAGDMATLGDNAWGWRWGSVVAGTLSIVFVFMLGRWLGLGEWAAVLAAFLYAFDNLVFVSSRIGILDIFMLLGMLAGAAWYVAKRPVLAGLAFAFGALCKEYGVYGPAIIFLYAVAKALYERPGWKELVLRALRVVAMGAVFLGVFAFALWQLDLRWSTYTNPLAHLQAIWSYGTKLTHPAGPTGIESWPWEWLINEVQIPYLKVTVTVCKVTMANNAPCPTDDIIRQFDSVLFRGALNPYLIAALPLALAYVISRLSGKDNRVALLSLIWFGVAYLPFIPAAVIDHRIEYLYYMLPVVPAIALACAALFSDKRIPRAVTWGFIVAIVYGFAGYFPFTGFRI